MTTLALSQPKHLLRLSDLALLLVAMVWGTSYGVAKGALAFYPVLGFLAVRFILTFVLLLPALWRTSRQQKCDALRTGLPLADADAGHFSVRNVWHRPHPSQQCRLPDQLCVVFTPFVEWWLLGCRPA